MAETDVTFADGESGGVLWASGPVATTIAGQLRRQGLTVDLSGVSDRDEPCRVVARTGGGVQLTARQLNVFVGGQFGVAPLTRDRAAWMAMERPRD